MSSHFHLRLLVAVVLGLIAAPTHAGIVQFTVNGIFYHGSDNNRASVWSHSSYSTLTAANIPKTVTYNNVTYTVTDISSGAFKNAKALKTVSIPATLTYISDQAFYGCTALTSVSIPAKAYIGKEAFYGCTALKTVTLASNITQLCEQAFKGCTALTSITIPETITSLPDEAFYGCTALKTATLPATLKTIGTSTFAACGLTAVTIPEGTTAVKPGAFADCAALARVNWNAINAADQNGNRSALGPTYTPFQRCPALKTFIFGSKVEHIPSYLCHSLEALAEVTIPASVSSLGFGLFAYCSGLKKVNYNAVNASYSMGSTYYNLLFYECGNLTQVVFGSEVQTIPACLFQRCKRIKTITVPAKVTSVQGCAFAECDSLTKVVWNAKACEGWNNADSGGPFNWNAYLINNPQTITTFIFGEGVEEIPAYLCYNMKSITTMTLPSTLKSIGNYAFYSCSGLTEINLPATVTKVGDSAFRGCGLSSLTLSPGITTIGSEAFANNGFKSLHIPASVTSIGVDAFRQVSLETITVDPGNTIYDSRDGSNVLVITATNHLLKGSISGYIPGSVTSIGRYAYYNLLDCENVEIPGGVTSINEYAFRTNTVKTLTIPASVTAISSYAFTTSFPDDTKTNLETVKCFITDPTAIRCADNIFVNNTKPVTTCRLIVPAGTEELYAANAPWSRFTTIETFNPADLNGDTTVNAGDVSLLFATIVDKAYSVRYDLNADGAVNTADVSLLYDSILR